MLRWAEHISRMGEGRGAKILTGKLTSKRSLGMPKKQITETYLALYPLRRDQSVAQETDGRSPNRSHSLILASKRAMMKIY